MTGSQASRIKLKRVKHRLMNVCQQRLASRRFSRLVSVMTVTTITVLYCFSYCTVV